MNDSFYPPYSTTPRQNFGVRFNLGLGLNFGVIFGLIFGVVSTITAPLALAQATAQSTKAGQATTPKAPAKHTPAAAKQSAPVAPDDDDDDGKGIDVQTSTVTEFTCDHGAKIAFYRNPGDDEHVAVRFGKEIFRMRRVPTTTGAERFESRRHGLVWIGIPAKSILLDSKKGQQLANGCRHAEQMTAQPKS